MILEQQIELHFGEQYVKVVSQTDRFCKYLIAKPWWGQNRQTLLTNEGGLKGMRWQALTYIIEKDDNITIGLKDYGNYLRAEYGKEYHALPLEEHIVSLKEKTDEPSYQTFLSDDGSPSDALQSLWKLLEKIALTRDEAEFFQIYASIQDVKETCELLSISLKDGRRIFDRVRHRATYRLMKR